MLRHRASIYRDFVRLGKNASRDHILAFANRWGALGEGERAVAVGGRVTSAASFATWRQNAVRIAMLTGLWQHVRSEDVEKLSDYVIWADDHVAVQIPHVSGRLRPDLITLYDTDVHRMFSGLAYPGDAFEQSVLASKLHEPQLLTRWTPGDPIEPMRYFVIREVNKALLGKVDRTVLPYWDGAVHYISRSLLSAIYIHFQDVITRGVRAERACVRCGTAFTVKRKDKRYCSDNCAKRASEARRRGGNGV